MHAKRLASSELVTAINISASAMPARRRSETLVASPCTTLASSSSSRWVQRSGSRSTMVTSLPSWVSRRAINWATWPPPASKILMKTNPPLRDYHRVFGGLIPIRSLGMRGRDGLEALASALMFGHGWRDVLWARHAAELSGLAVAKACWTSSGAGADPLAHPVRCGISAWMQPRGRCGAKPVARELTALPRPRVSSFHLTSNATSRLASCQVGGMLRRSKSRGSQNRDPRYGLGTGGGSGGEDVDPRLLNAG